MTIARLMRLAMVSVLIVGPAWAGILDSPPPSFPGKGQGVVLYRISPIYYEPGRVDTVVTCHNPGGQGLPAAVEVFDGGDRPHGSVARAIVPAGGDVLFTTSATTGLDQTTVIPGLSPLPSGKARVSATSAELSCTATHRVRGSDGSLKEMPVELVKKVAPGPR